MAIKVNGYEYPFYDDYTHPDGNVFVHRHSIGITGFVRAKTWEDAYSVCEDEFFPEADLTIEEIKEEYGFEREHRKVIKGTAPEPHPKLGFGEKFAVYPDDYSDHGKLPVGSFVRWETLETPNPDAWPENELFCEAYGFRPNGPNEKDKIGHGIYEKDLNGDALELLTIELAQRLGVTEFDIPDIDE